MSVPPTSVPLAYIDTPAHSPENAAPIIILHGLFGSKRNWSAIAKRLSTHHRVICVDLRNHGESPWIDAMDYPALSHDVADLIDRLELGPCTVIGHSMGGKTAMMLALTQPESVTRLVVVDIAPVARQTDFGPYIEAMAAVPLAACDSRTAVEAHLVEAVPDPQVRSFLVQNLVRDPATGFHWRINLAALDAGLNDIADFALPASRPPYTDPALFIAGGASDYLQAQHHAVIRTLFDDVTITTIPGAGHWLHAEVPDAFLNALTDFLGS